MDIQSSWVSATGTFSVNGRDIIPNISTALVWHERQTTPLTSLMMHSGQMERTPTMFHQWNEFVADDPHVISGAIASAGAGVTQEILLQSQNVRIGETFVEASTQQQFIVLDVRQYNAGTALAVITRSPFTLATTAVTGTPTLIRTAPIVVEGGPYAEPVTAQPVRKTNGLNYLSDSYSVTDVMAATPTYYNQGDEMSFQEQALYIRIRASMERRAWWSKMATDRMTQGGITGPTYQADGVIEQIPSENKVSYTTSITESGMDAFMSFIFSYRNYGSDVKYGFCGPNVFSNINAFAKQKLRIMSSGETEYGLKVSRYEGYTGGQTVYMVLEREFVDLEEHKGTMVVLDPAFIKYAYHGSALIEVGDISQPGLTKDSVGLTSRFAPFLQMGQAHSMFYKAAA
jgi:hypothetical protein